MKKIFYIDDRPENKITYYHLLLFIASLPFDRFYSQLFLISLVIHSTIQLKKENLRALPWKKIFILQTVYLLTLAGTIYSNYPSIAFGLWEKQLAILIFPVLFLTNPIDLKKYIQPLLLAFMLVNVFVIIYLYYDAFVIISFYDMPFSAIFSGLFFSHKFSAPIDIHATYLSLYVALSLVALLTNFLNRQNKKTAIILASAAAAILALGLLQLGSRAVIVGLLIVLAFIVPLYIQHQKTRKRFITLVILVSITLSAAVFVSDGLYYRYVKTLKSDLGLSEAEFSLADPRAARWELAWQLVIQKPLAGHGTGDEVPLLKEKYFASKYYDSYLHELNAHNQYLSFLLKGGFIGLAIFLLAWYYFFRLAWTARNLMFTSFLVLLTIVFFSENVLNVNKGIFFYAFFLSLFACAELKKMPKPYMNAKPGNPVLKKNVFTRKVITT